jgi:DNA repair protein RecO (recombination protein O)
VDKGYVLHSYPYRETSLILQMWTEKHGRLALVAKGARRPKSASRSVLVPFQPLSLDWFGRGELRTLKTAEPASPATPLGGSSLLSAFYLNELLLKLTTRDDPHEGLFAAYDEAITSLRSITRQGPRVAASVASEPAAQAVRDIEPVLRRFELRLLQELGYAVELTREARTHAPIEAERDYWYVAERGPIAAPGLTTTGAGSEGVAPANAVRLRGQTLIDLAHGVFDDVVTIGQSKQLMRLLIHHSLNGQELATRVLVRDLQRLDEEHGTSEP